MSNELKAAFDNLIKAGKDSQEMAYVSLAALIKEAVEIGIHAGMSEGEIIAILKSPIEPDEYYD